MNKQIEEMACDMCTVKLNCNKPHTPIPSCTAYKYSVNAYDHNYRKASDVAAEIIALLTEIGDYFMSRGDILQVGAIMAAIDTIKKKYESVGE